MSKNLLAVSAFSILLFAFTSVSYAQEEDSRGIVPLNEVQSLQGEPVETRRERLEGLINEERAGYESAKSRYISVLQNPVDNASDNYKLNVILISARYHKLVDLYYGYLLKIDRSFAESATGFEIVNPDDELNQAEQKIIGITSALDDFDSTIDSVSGITEAELSALEPELLDKSTRIKLQLEEVKTDLLDIVSTLE